MPQIENVALGTGSDGLLELVATTGGNGSGASVWRARQTSSGDQWAVGWQPLGKPGRGEPSSLSVIRQRPGGCVEAFVVDDQDCAVWHSWQTDPQLGWSDWDLLGNPGGSHVDSALALVILPHDRVMAVVAADGSVWHVSSPPAGAERVLARVDFSWPSARRPNIRCFRRDARRQPDRSVWTENPK